MPKRTYVIKGIKKGAKNFSRIDSTPLWKFAVNKATKAMNEGKYQKITIFSEEEKKTFYQKITIFSEEEKKTFNLNTGKGLTK